MRHHPATAATLRATIVSATLLALCACGDKTPQPGSNTTGVERATANDTTAIAAPAMPAPVSKVIQSQPGPSGSVVTLNKVKVTGDVLTVQLTFTGKGAVPVLKLDEISLIDDKTAQRIGMLKDDAGKPMASPISSDGTDLAVNLYESPAIVWFKFPAPPATSPTVSLNIPEVAPFDGVPVER